MKGKMRIHTQHRPHVWSDGTKIAPDAVRLELVVESPNRWQLGPEFIAYEPAHSNAIVVEPVDPVSKKNGTAIEESRIPCRNYNRVCLELAAVVEQNAVLREARDLSIILDLDLSFDY